MSEINLFTMLIILGLLFLTLNILDKIKVKQFRDLQKELDYREKLLLRLEREIVKAAQELKQEAQTQERLISHFLGESEDEKI